MTSTSSMSSRTYQICGYAGIDTLVLLRHEPDLQLHPGLGQHQRPVPPQQHFLIQTFTVLKSQRLVEVSLLHTAFQTLSQRMSGSGVPSMEQSSLTMVVSSPASENVFEPSMLKPLAGVGLKIPTEILQNHSRTKEMPMGQSPLTFIFKVLLMHLTEAPSSSKLFKAPMDRNFCTE